ncbi:MAG: hypothetical protein JST42_02625 [Bacteroidetes bacterium]|nr:hypothetical protein [Bacteroidota bacterium]
MNIGDDFLIVCKQNYFDKVTPGNKDSKLKPGYKKLVGIAEEYFKHGSYEKFAGFFQEGQYFIELWAAHLMLEYGTPSRALMNAAMDIVRKYSDNPLAPEVAHEERHWLDAYSGKYM